MQLKVQPATTAVSFRMIFKILFLIFVTHSYYISYNYTCIYYVHFLKNKGPVNYDYFSGRVFIKIGERVSGVYNKGC